jgi:hypothetical protein
MNAIDTPPRDYVREYRQFSDMVEEFASENLASTYHRFTYRLFVLGHGPAQDRAKMKPIYSSTCSIRGNRDRRPSVLERTIDEDFALCAYNEGCTRCRK